MARLRLESGFWFLFNRFCNSLISKFFEAVQNSNGSSQGLGTSQARTCCESGRKKTSKTAGVLPVWSPPSSTSSDLNHVQFNISNSSGPPRDPLLCHHHFEPAAAARHFLILAPASSCLFWCCVPDESPHKHGEPSIWIGCVSAQVQRSPLM